MTTLVGNKRRVSLDALVVAAADVESYDEPQATHVAKKPTLASSALDRAASLSLPSSSSDSHSEAAAGERVVMPIAQPAAAVAASLDDSVSLLTPMNIIELRELGYTVVPNIVEPAVCATRHIELLDEMAKRGVNWRDPNVSRSSAPQIHGIVQHLEIGHTAAVWATRQEERVARVFEELYGDNDLLVSFDGICLWRESDKDDGKRWWHVDQSHKKPGLRCIQGALVMAPCDGGLAVLPGSHKQHATFAQQHAPRAATMNDDWFKYEPDEFAALQALTGTSPTLVTPPVGSLVLWDSRTAHMAQMAPANAPRERRSRCAIYLCYQPRALISAANLVKKRNAFDSYRMTTHWPASTVKLFPGTWRTWGRAGTAHNPTPEERTRVDTTRVLELAGKIPLTTRRRRRTQPALEFVKP